MLQQAIDGAEQAGLRRSRHGLAGQGLSEQARSHRAPGAPLGRLLLALRLHTLALREASRPVFGLKALHVLGSDQEATGVELVVREKLLEFAGHGRCCGEKPPEESAARQRGTVSIGYRLSENVISNENKTQRKLCVN